MAAGNFWENLAGTFSDLFGVGGSNGPTFKDNSGVLEVRNSDDSAFQIARGLTPVGNDDFVTKLYADSLEKPLIVSRQADCSVSLPNNTAVQGWVVVSTAGSGAVIGDMLFDDGSGSGTMAIVSVVEGRTIAVTDSLSGGTATFDADSIYIWDSDGSAWIKIGDIGSVTGARRTIRVALGFTAAQDTTTQIPAGNRVWGCWLEVTSPYNGGATISVGDTVTADKFMTTLQNNPQAASRYHVKQDTSQAAASVVRTTVTGGTLGAGVLVIEFGAILA